MSDAATEKEKIRKSMLKIRNSVPETELFERSKLVQNNVLNSSHFANSETLGVYYPVGSEVRTEEIIQKALNLAKKVALPIIDSDKMKFYQVNLRHLQDNTLVTGKFGLKEPVKKGAEITKIDLLIVPGIAFDHEGARIGYGRGYFDRYIRGAKVSFSLGLGYRFQLISKSLPQSDLDQRINGLSTEDCVLYF
ncbi:MAG: 5-formyltetrahydrofolate cyclo-ligase [Thermoproteota archaeon]|nr:5-formyltetrahydrofolate cyclo-ligase [Thermoproteota archaeon]